MRTRPRGWAADGDALGPVRRGAPAVQINVLSPAVQCAGARPGARSVLCSRPGARSVLSVLFCSVLFYRSPALPSVLNRTILILRGSLVRISRGYSVTRASTITPGGRGGKCVGGGKENQRGGKQKENSTEKHPGHPRPSLPRFSARNGYITSQKSAKSHAQQGRILEYIQSSIY